MCGDFEDYDDSQGLRAELRQAKERNDKLARLLCEACGVAFDGDPDWAASTDLMTWWHEHKAEDQARQRAESELKALSPEALKMLKAKGYQP
jgi:hypothetical protein